MSGTKKVKIPEPFKLGPEQELYKMGHYVRFVIDNHPLYTSDGKGMRAGVRLERAFGIDKPEEEWPETGAEVELLDADHKQFNTACENPPPVVCGRCGSPLGFGGYPVRPPGLLLPFLESVEKAEST